MDIAENSCLVCHEAMEIFAIGKCDHPICYKCSTRMRGLCEQFYCSICRTDLPEVFFLTTKEKFLEMPARKFILNRKLKIQFENEKIRQKFEELLEHRCRICKDRYPEKSFKALQDHMRRVHTMFFCDLCLGLKIFSSERKCYSRQDLAIHRRRGDQDDTSYKGHPLCQFCDERYLDKDELYKHLRKDHYFCHFCESLGSQDFFQEYSNLRDHFQSDHFLCEEGDCIDKQFENAFRSEIDFKAHQATYHSRALSKFQSRQERTLNIDINLVPRPTNRGRGGMSRNDYADVGSEGGRKQSTAARKNYSSKREKEDVDRAIQASLSTMSEEALKKDKKKETQDKAEKEQFVDSIENFPALGEQAQTANTLTTAVATTTESSSLANKFAMSHNMSVGRGVMDSVEDFPVLKKSASGYDLGNIQQPVISYQTLKSSQPPAKSAKPVKKTQPPKHKSPSNTFSNSLAFQDKVEDFPELPKGQKRNIKFATPVSTWQNVVQPSETQSSEITSNVSVIKEKPNEPPVRKEKVSRPTYDETDFPSLRGSVVPGPPLSSKWFKGTQNNSGGKNSVKSYEETSSGNQNTDFSFIDGFSPVIIPSTPECDKKTKNNKKKKKKDTAKPKDEISKNSTKNYLNGNNSLDDIASLLMNTDANKTAEKETRKKNDVRPKEVVSEVSQKRSEKISKEKEDNIEKKMEESHIDTEPIEVEKTEKMNPVVFVKEEDEFPTLGAPKKASKKPPPGFRQEKNSQTFKAPPGFSQQVSKKPPPGFTSQTPLPETNISSENMPLSNHLANYEYYQPTGFFERNKELIGVIQSYCEDPHDFTEFKRLSGEFRRLDMGARMYYESCEELLGKENFSNVFSELLALLPDISKQQELLSVYIMKNGMKKDGVLAISKKPRGGKGAWTPTLSGFLTCQTCHQVLVRKDYNTHMTIHNVDTDFPALSGEAPVANSKFGSYGSWVKAK